MQRFRPSMAYVIWIWRRVCLSLYSHRQRAAPCRKELLNCRSPPPQSKQLWPETRARIGWHGAPRAPHPAAAVVDCRSARRMISKQTPFYMRRRGAELKRQPRLTALSIKTTRRRTERPNWRYFSWKYWDGEVSVFWQLTLRKIHSNDWPCNDFYRFHSSFFYRGSYRLYRPVYRCVTVAFSVSLPFTDGLPQLSPSLPFRLPMPRLFKIWRKPVNEDNPRSNHKFETSK